MTSPRLDFEQVFSARADLLAAVVLRPGAFRFKVAFLIFFNLKNFLYRISIMIIHGSHNVPVVSSIYLYKVLPKNFAYEGQNLLSGQIHYVEKYS